MEHNPYAPPSAAIADVVVAPEDDELASRAQRFVNMLIDAVGYVLVGIVILAGLLLVDESFEERLDSANEYLLTIVFMTLYYLPLEALFGRTLGKLVTGTRTVSDTGGPPSFGQILGRTVARFIPFEAFTFLSGDRPVGLHDRASGTRVIRVRGVVRRPGEPREPASAHAGSILGV